MFVFCFGMHYFVSYLVFYHFKGEWEPLALRVLYYGRFLAVSALWPFPTVP